MKKQFMYVCDLENPKTGVTYREENRAMTHNIPVGTLVEDIDTGVRLFVVYHTRDCDETPLYCLCHDKNNTTKKQQRFYNSEWLCGYPEKYLKEIKR